MAEREKLEKEKLEEARAEKEGRRVRVDMLTSGGDYQALNTTIRGIAKALYNLYDSVGIVGFQGSYHDLMYEDYRLLLKNDFSGILTQGDTLLGAGRQPFKQMAQPDRSDNNKVGLVRTTYHELGLGCPYVLGDSGSQKTTNLPRQEGLNVVSLPKTIDSDLFSTDKTFGFQSAVEIASNAIDCIHTTAAFHGRVFIVEIMEYRVGWFTLYAGIAGGADIIPIPGIPYNTKAVIEALRKRQRTGSRFSAIIVTEGTISKKTMALSKKERKTKLASRRCSSAAYEIGAEIQAVTGQEIRAAVSGHTQCGGAPNPYDRVLSSRLGTCATKLTGEDRFDEMAIIRNDKITSIPPEESVGKLKTVDPNSSVVEETRLLGLSFGDR